MTQTPVFYRKSILLIFFLAVGGSCPAFSQSSVRSFSLTYEFSLEAIPSDAQELKVWVPLATSDQFQTIRQRTIRAPFPYEITQDPEYGNDILYLNLKSPLPSSLEVAIQYEAIVHGQAILGVPLKDPPGSWLKENLDLHLRSNRLMVVNKEVQELAKAVTQGAETPLDKARAIYRYVIERMTYEKQTPGWGRGDTLRACEVGAGNCTDFHSLFISLARAVGIPARFRIGTPVPEAKEGEIPGYHCWAEFFLKGFGWIPVDASEAWKDRGREVYFFGTYDPNRLTVSTGRDIRLSPQPANGPVNIFFYPYVEIDGELFDRFSTRFRFQDLAVS